MDTILIRGIPPAAVMGLLLAIAPPVCADDAYYHLKDITIGGPTGTPSLSIDPKGRRLYLTHSSRIEVVDLETGTTTFVTSPSAHSFVVAPKLNRGFVSDSRNGTVAVIDLATMKTTASVKAGAGAASLLYEPAHDMVYAFSTRTPSATIFDAGSGKVAATVPLSAKPGPAAADSELGRVYCTLMEQNEIAVLDTRTHQVAGAWSVAPGKQPAAVAVDTVNHRVFAACRNKQLVMLDGATGHFKASVAIGAGVDGAAFDPVTHTAFCANSDGTATLVREETPDHLTLAQSLATERNARIMALDPLTHKIYLTTTDFEAQLPPDDGAAAKRPRTLPNSLKILVYGPAGR
jgi:DNA-binding beta-propeller fold protein YncE